MSSDSLSKMKSLERMAVAMERTALAAERNADNFAFVINELRPFLTLLAQQVASK